MIKIVEGDILQAKEDIICHQVNCVGVMGAGLAKQIKSKYPEVFSQYKQLVDWVQEEDKRGCVKKEKLLGSVVFANTKDGKTVANIFGQDGIGRNIQQTDYVALEKGLRSIHSSVTNEWNYLYNSSIALPYGIGCGLAGGDWNVVYKIIDDVFSDYEVVLYKLN